MKQISYSKYCVSLHKARVNDKKAYLNCNAPFEKDGTKYFQSNEGISYLHEDGFMGGLCRTSKGSERLAELHQQHRIKLSGYFLECYEGKLSSMYAKQGFKVVSRIAFDPQFAPKGWEDDDQLQKLPDVVFMSLHKADEVVFYEYQNAYNHASSSKNIHTTKG